MSGFEIKSVRGTSDRTMIDGIRSPGTPVRTASPELPGRKIATATRANFFEDLSGPEGHKSFPIPHLTAYSGLSSIYHEKAELDILSKDAESLVDLLYPRSKVLVEFIGGRPSITLYLLAGIEKLGVPVKYYAVSSSSIEILKLIGLHGSYEDACDWLAENEYRVPKTILWLSHSISSIDRIDVAVFLRRLTSHLLQPGDLVMLGTERRGTAQDPVLSCGKGSEWNKRRLMDNLLRSYGLYFESARETFSTDAWDLQDEYDPNIGARRCYIVAKRDIRLTNNIFVKVGEKVLMEQSWKYDDGDIAEMLQYTGLDSFHKFTDSVGEYALRLLMLPPDKTPKQFGAMKAYFDQKQG
ncbi:hypothetical protein EV426DRAFT_571860 [Tirmania nivea]|nr:hypothetical protein EV426DRAFT_571860 [Tirmania nivea]